MNAWHLTRDDAISVQTFLGMTAGGFYDGFVDYMATPVEHGHEWRFGGVLGFGGKLHLSRRGLYVTAYPEDLTPENRKLIDAINDRLRESVRPLEVTS